MTIPMDNYEADVVSWAQHQAELLRRHAAGEKLNEAPDWANIIEEIEDVGRSELRAVKSLLEQALTHALKIRAWPDSREVPHWQAEVRAHRLSAQDDFRPSMRQLLSIARMYRVARAGIPDSLDGLPAQPLPDQSPWSLEDLLADGDLH